MPKPETRASTAFQRLARLSLYTFRFFIGYWILNTAWISIRAFCLYSIANVLYMKIVLFAVALLFSTLASYSQKQNRYFELRIYYCHPGRLDALIERFANHTTKLFEKHGMTNIGYWVPENNTKNALYYILAFPNKAACDSSWAAFKADPDWIKVKTASEESGPIIKSIESLMMNPLEFSKIK